MPVKGTLGLRITTSANKVVPFTSVVFVPVELYAAQPTGVVRNRKRPVSGSIKSDVTFFVRLLLAW